MLYNIKTDPGETANVYNQYPEVVRELTALMKKYVEEGRSTPGLHQRNDGDYPWAKLNWMQ